MKSESEACSISWDLGRPIYDKTNSTSLELKRGRRGDIYVCFGIKEEGVLYNSSGKNMNEMAFNEGWQRMKENHEPKPNFRV